MKHKHYDLIVAWAEGKDIQWFDAIKMTWQDFSDGRFYPSTKYRIKPEPKPDVVVYSRVVGKFLIGCGNIEINQLILRLQDSPNIKYTFDGEWGNLKSAEVL
jgi:hypothetical protein